MQLFNASGAFRGGQARLIIKHKADERQVLAVGLSVTHVDQMASGDEFWVEPAPLAPASEVCVCVCVCELFAGYRSSTDEGVS
jgi:hypothetical protein